MNTSDAGAPSNGIMSGSYKTQHPRRVICIFIGIGYMIACALVASYIDACNIRIRWKGLWVYSDPGGIVSLDHPNSSTRNDFLR